jgi:hypothetical protein
LYAVGIMVHVDCPKLDSLWDSHEITHKETERQKRRTATGANSRKWDTFSQLPKVEGSDDTTNVNRCPGQSPPFGGQEIEGSADTLPGLRREVEHGGGIQERIDRGDRLETELARIRGVRFGNAHDMGHARRIGEDAQNQKVGDLQIGLVDRCWLC